MNCFWLSTTALWLSFLLLTDKASCTIEKPVLRRKRMETLRLNILRIWQPTWPSFKGSVPLHEKRWLALREERKQRESLLEKKTPAHLRKLKWVNNRKQLTHSRLGWITWFVFLSSPFYCLPFGYFLGTCRRGGGCIGSDTGREKIISQFCILLVTLEKGWVETEEDSED